MKFPLQGIYLREGEGIRIYQDLQDFLRERGFNKSYTLGILFSRHYLVNEDMEVVDMLIDKLGEHFNLIPVFTYGTRNGDLGAWSSAECIEI